MKDILTILAPFFSGIITSILFDRRATSKNNHSYLIQDYKQVVNENRELRIENKKLREELNKNDD